jgi:adenylate cyclase
MATTVTGERRIVSVLIADVVNSTGIGERLGPERSKFLLDEVQRIMTAQIHRYDGTVVQRVGDEIFAVFGAPFPHADHAQRALECAVAMQRAAKDMASDLAGLGLPPLTYGIGLNSGPVVAAHMGGGLRKQYGVIGDTVNVGARLCALAQVGEVTLPEMVRRRLTDEPELEPLGDVSLKGVSEDPKVQRVKLPGLPPLSERLSRKEEDKAKVKTAVDAGDTP